MIREVAAPVAADEAIARAAPSPEGLAALDSLLGPHRLVGSGKGAIAVVLRYLAERGVLRSKLDEVMVADWIGYWVYDQIQPFAFPAKRRSERTRAILVYHQYGFPQDMDRILAFAREHSLVVVEDCAHALGGEYRGRRLGSLGDHSIWSFSKFFFCLALGAVGGADSELLDFADGAIGAAPAALSWLKDGAKLLYELTAGEAPGPASTVAGHALNMSYAIYGDALRPTEAARALAAAKVTRELDCRRARYAHFRDRAGALGTCDHLEERGVVPYVIPITVAEAARPRLVERLRARGVATGVYRFDMARCLLAPRFEPVVWIPCHAGLSDLEFEGIIDDVRRTL